MNNQTDISPITYRFDGKGGVLALDAQSVKLAGKSRGKGNGRGFDWLYLFRDSNDTAATLTETGLDEFVIEALMAEDTRPRFTPHGNGAILNLRGVNLNPGQDPTDMVSLRFWIDERRVVGIWLRRAYAVRDTMEAMERGIVPTSPSDLVCKIAFRLVDRAEPIIAELSDQMDLIERDEAGGFGAGQSALIEIRQDASRLRRFLAPQRDALTTFAIEEFPWLSERDQSRLKKSAERFTRLGEELEQIRERAMIAHDEMLAERSDRMNRTMLILAVLSTIFLPLGFLTGLFGINVGGMPGTDNPYAFWIICGMSLVLAGILWILVKLSKMMD